MPNVLRINETNFVIRANKELFECCIGWKANLKDDKKFEVIDPNDLFANIDKVKYQPLIDYLSIRYWND